MVVLTLFIFRRLLVHHTPTIPPDASQFPTGGSWTNKLSIVVYDISFLVLRRATELLYHGGSRMIKSNRELVRVYEVNPDEADGNASMMNEERAGM